MHNMDSIVLKKKGIDLGIWSHSNISSIPRTIVVNIDELKLPAEQIRMESGLNILARLVIDRIRNGNRTAISSEQLHMIKSMLDPSIIAMVPHHMVKGIFHLSDQDLKELRTDDIVEYQEISNTYIYHWDMLRSEWLSVTLKTACQ